jgi:hypothetical protein
MEAASFSIPWFASAVTIAKSPAMSGAILR